MRLLVISILVFCINAAFVILDQTGVFVTATSSTNNPLLEFNNNQTARIANVDPPDVGADQAYDPTEGISLSKAGSGIKSFFVGIVWLPKTMERLGIHGEFTVVFGILGLILWTAGLIQFWRQISAHGMM